MSRASRPWRPPRAGQGSPEPGGGGPAEPPAGSPSTSGGERIPFLLMPRIPFRGRKVISASRPGRLGESGRGSAEDWRMAAPPTGPTPASAPGSLNGFPARSEKHYGVPAYAMSPTASTPVAAVCPRRAEQSRAQPLPFFFVQSTVWVSSSNLENIYVITADSKRGSINNLLSQLHTEHCSCSLQEFKSTNIS